MNARNPSTNPPPRTLTTVFTSGNSQAVRLPKEFRFSTKQVTIERRGDEVVLRERTRSLGQTLREALADIAPLTDAEARQMESALTGVRKGPETLEARAMWSDPEFWGNTAKSGAERTNRNVKAKSALDKAKVGRP